MYVRLRLNCERVCACVRVCARVCEGHRQRGVEPTATKEGTWSVLERTQKCYS